MARRTRIELPERKRNYTFALTPLADAMFQLLIFFMLSSSLTPYSLLTVQSGPGAAPEEGALGDGSDTSELPDPAMPIGDVALWTLEAATVIVGGTRFDYDALADLADAVKASGANAEVILIVRPSAQVQDITTVLAQLRISEITNVQITSGAS